MSMPSAEALRSLAAKTADPAISIYMPVLRAGKDLRQNPTRLRNLVREAESRFQEAGRPGSAEIAKLLEPAAALAEDSEFWRDQNQGLALFLAEGTNQSLSVIAVIAPSCAASWPLTGAKVPICPERCSFSMRSSKRRASSIVRKPLTI